MIPDFIPIETDHGMSIVTAICGACVLTMGGLIVKYFWNKQSETDEKLCKHEEMITDIRVSMSSFESKLESVSTTVHKIDNKLDQNLSGFAWANQQAMMKLMESKQ